MKNFKAELTRLELAASCVTGRRSNQTELQLQYISIFYLKKKQNTKIRLFLEICKLYYYFLFLFQKKCKIRKDNKNTVDCAKGKCGFSNPGRNRTCGPKFRKLVLYPTELRSQNLCFSLLYRNSLTMFYYQ